ncbi:hypothetical protein FRB90_012511 [Tulasnella sp. 427]|nr:hypothetical protein FRB90_012511 [Tulasnella sp. 427]
MPLPRVPSEDAPYPSKNPTDLQKHVAAFDRDGDGLITVADTCWALQKIGVSWIGAVIGCIVVHLFSSYVTQESWLPDPWFRIRIAGVHRIMHASSAGTFRQRGILDPVTFDSLFEMYGNPSEQTMTLQQVLTMWKNSRDMHDVFGTLANLGEWFGAWVALKGKDGKIKKEDLRSLIIGDYFHKAFGDAKKKP